MLTRVTITGADNSVKYEDLHALSDAFSFVEWGVLRSRGRGGTPRYPSSEWRAGLSKYIARRPQIRLAAHLCGEYTRAVLDGRDWPLDVTTFQRHQINGFKLPAPDFIELARRTETEFILQVRSEADLPALADVARSLGEGRASLLFDPSCGRGIEAFRFPAKPDGVSMGYAGGIRPATVEYVLKEIGPVNGDFWIDMESGVRTDDRFDLGLVREVLERAAPLVHRTK